MVIVSRFDDPGQAHDFIIYDPPWPMPPMYYLRTERFGGGVRNVPYCPIDYVQMVAFADLGGENIIKFNKNRKEELATLQRAEDAKRKAQSATVTKPTAVGGQGSAGAA